MCECHNFKFSYGLEERAMRFSCVKVRAQIAAMDTFICGGDIGDAYYSFCFVCFWPHRFWCHMHCLMPEMNSHANSSASSFIMALYTAVQVESWNNISATYIYICINREQKKYVPDQSLSPINHCNRDRIGRPYWYCSPVWCWFFHVPIRQNVRVRLPATCACLSLCVAIQIVGQNLLVFPFWLQNHKCLHFEKPVSEWGIVLFGFLLILVRGFACWSWECLSFILFTPVFTECVCVSQQFSII